MLKRSYLIAAVGAVIVLSLYTRFWVQVPLREPITVQSGTVMVENQTALEWRNVVVTVNDHFHGGTPSLAPGGRLNAPLGQFATSHGQRFDRSRQSVVKIQVKATAADGTAVRLEWLARTTT